ncbi:hypothetical protein E8D34_10835 [Nocardioides sp. GY 10113]|uniref:PH domain-containing protein n=1 Tax=Nocardioides sp. GY 10113 TaxID=2569761 RepID=UPI0010A76312|nr:PH domain-containing protein [Nocardioides sp. GY 10113]TIC86735.1 hypothetical protein E8D34_10835 [Nocardioides sp. GY 10113]
MLLIHALNALWKFVPVLIGLAAVGNGLGSALFYLGVGMPVAIGVIRYLTTEYRVTADRVELRRGLLERRTTSAPLDRVRSIDLTATLPHRVLGLTTVVVGTGEAASLGDRISLDALPTPAAGALRTDLLHRAQADAEPADGAGAPASDQAAPARETVARFEPTWLLFSVFTSAGLVAFGAALGAAAYFAELVDVDVELLAEELSVPRVSVATVAGVVVSAGILALALTLGGYLVTNGNFSLTRDSRAWHVHRGLLTTRETSLDLDRLAGVEIGEAAAMRLARGGRLRAIATGLTGAAAGAVDLVPPAPRATVRAAAAAALDTPAPVDAPLRHHGAAARQRRYTRALLAGSPSLAAPAIAVAVGGAPLWTLAAAPALVALLLLLGRDRSRSLGHAWVDGYVVMRSGSLARRRTALAGEHVIGWNLRASWFQRRAGLVTVAATTAGGSGSTEVYDVPTADAERLADQATPGLLAQFRAGS